MATGNEKKALQIIYEAGEETTSRIVGRKMGIDTGYARLLCMNLARQDYADMKKGGRFRITFKGKRALGKIPSAGTGKIDQRTPFGRLHEERLTWGVMSNSSYRSAQAFDKPAEEEKGWSIAKIDRLGRLSSKWTREMPIGKLLTETSYTCGFCHGKGEKPKVATCFVCMGTGKVSANPPAVICAFCKGEGEEKTRSNMACSVCRGKGIVSVTEPVESCKYCRGTGRDHNSKLSCLKCRGKGVVTTPELRRAKL